MARHKTAAPPGDLRRTLAERDRASCTAYYGALGQAPPPGRAEKIEAGKPVVVAGWELSGFVPGVEPDAWYRVDPDGSVTEVPPPLPPQGLRRPASRNQHGASAASSQGTSSTPSPTDTAAPRPSGMSTTTRATPPDNPPAPPARKDTT
ncbi:MAG: hypothetical protein WKF86_09605 [Acidimicrobiales bacterium]